MANRTADCQQADLATCRCLLAVNGHCVDNTKEVVSLCGSPGYGQISQPTIKPRFDCA
jgi:hypothetical protein